MMKHIVLCPNLIRDKELKLTAKVSRFLRSYGITPTVCPVFEKGSENGLQYELKFSTLEQELPTAD
jgi:hypothetical protein